jgi:exonuclease III
MFSKKSPRYPFNICSKNIDVKTPRKKRNKAEKQLAAFNRFNFLVSNFKPIFKPKQKTHFAYQNCQFYSKNSGLKIDGVALIPRIQTSIS